MLVSLLRRLQYPAARVPSYHGDFVIADTRRHGSLIQPHLVRQQKTRVKSWSKLVAGPKPVLVEPANHRTRRLGSASGVRNVLINPKVGKHRVDMLTQTTSRITAMPTSVDSVHQASERVCNSSSRAVRLARNSLADHHPSRNRVWTHHRHQLQTVHSETLEVSRTRSITHHRVIELLHSGSHKRLDRRGRVYGKSCRSSETMASCGLSWTAESRPMSVARANGSGNHSVKSCSEPPVRGPAGNRKR